MITINNNKHLYLSNYTNNSKKNETKLVAGQKRQRAAVRAMFAITSCNDEGMKKKIPY